VESHRQVVVYRGNLLMDVAEQSYIHCQ
jgi:hypothetical protein